jgi:hypothetical protein
LVPDEGHVSDFLVQVLVDPAIREKFALDSPHQSFLAFTDKKGFENVLRRPDIWVPSREAAERLNTGVGVSNVGAPTQWFEITRRQVPIEEWGQVRIGYLKETSINRRDILKYVANQLGGVHYDSKRLPNDLNDVTQFKVLATAYDWENEAIMHAGLIAVAMACIEIRNNPDIVQLYLALRNFHSERHQRLMRGEKLT